MEQCTKCKSSLYHATLLFDANLELLDKVLSLKKCAESKATKSVSSKVTNLKPLLSISIEEFMKDCLTYIINNSSKPSMIKLKAKDYDAINKLCEEKYKLDTFVFGNTPLFKINKDILINGVNYKLKVVIRNWNICECIIENNENTIVLDKLFGCKFDKVLIRDILTDNYPNYLNLIDVIF